MQNRQLAAQLAAREPDGRRPVVMHHRWDSLLFLHWTVPAESIRKTLPSGLTVDTRNEKAYLGITVFFMQKVRLTGFPPFPWFSAFQELNVRTYVVDRAGVPGVWFYSLDCNQPLAVVGARASTGLPYFRAKMTSAIGEYIDYSSRRIGSDQTARYRYRTIGESTEAEPESLEFFLLERYYLFCQRRRSLLRAQVSHPPYKYCGADVKQFSTVPGELDGFVLEDPPVHCCFVEGLEVKIHATQRVAE